MARCDEVLTWSTAIWSGIFNATCLVLFFVVHSPLVGPSVAVGQETETVTENRIDQGTAAAAVLDEEESEEDFADEDFEEEDFEEEDLVEELRELRRNLGQRIEHLERRKKNSEECLATIDAVLRLAQLRERLETALEEAEERDDATAIERLDQRLGATQQSMEDRQQLVRLQRQAMEVDEQLIEARLDEDVEREELLEGLWKCVLSAKELAMQLVRNREQGTEQELEQLEDQIVDLMEDRAERHYEALELLEELRDAEDEDDFEYAEELQQELDRLLGSNDVEVKQGVNREPIVAPIVINSQTLASYADTDLQVDVKPLLEQYCFDCHSEDQSSGELNFEKLLAASPIVKNRQKWINVIEQTKNHVMPPEDSAQPSIEERKKLVLSLHSLIANFDYSQVKHPGLEPARRLTHREYSNTVRDLFGVDIDVVDRFPDDLTATSGFDNSANTLFIQPLLMERYMGLAEYVVSAALPAVPRTSKEKLAHQRVFLAWPKKDRDVETAARAVMRKFLLRAFRRPPGEDEITRFVERVQSAVVGGAQFDDAVRLTLQAVLVSPSFLLRSEAARPDAEGDYRVGNFELASRLSYFIWASMPDDQLLELAREGELANPKTLMQQVDRMLSDPKSETLGSVFAAQWLGSRHLGTRMRLDPIDNPWCTDTLMAAMRQETSLFFHTLVRENRPISELIDADYTFVNEELAKLYRIEGILGEQMRRVNVDPERRGGIFGQGSLLAVTSFPGRTSPVVRGKWILDTVLGTPPPPPPPNVSELPEEIEGRRRLSFREKLELHREKPNCYACHSQMDPLGFSLENFDWFGRFRTGRGRRRIDNTGQLPNGTQFTGLAGLKRVVLEQRQGDLIRQTTRKLLSYALGRQLEYYDEMAVREIMQEVAEQDNRLGVLVREIVLSYPFQFKRAVATKEDESVR